MSSEPPAPEPTPEPNEFEKLRDEFKSQFDTLKSSFEAEMKTLKEQNEKLTKDNNDLQRALIRSATVPPAPEDPKEKSEEEKYTENIEKLSKRTLELMSR